MSAFTTPLDAITLHPTGWLDLPGGAAITRLPLWDSKDSLFARIGHGPAGAWLAERGLRLPSVAEFDLLHRVALHIEPFTMPTAEQLRAAGVKDSAARIDAFRTANMRSMPWCVQHDAEVHNRLARAGWDGEPVANAGKHWAEGGIIVGWWHANGSRIQNPSAFHAAVPTYTDYATTTHAVRPAPDDASADTERSPGAESLLWRDPRHTLGERCCAWLGDQLERGLLREFPGPANNPAVLALSKHCRRGGTLLGVEADGSPRWRGGSPLALKHDADPWCAATASESLRCCLLPGERPPHGLRVSVRELVEDAKVQRTIWGPEYTPLPGDLAILARDGENPMRGGRGHVRRVLLVEGDRYHALGGNEGDALTLAWHPLREPALVGFVAYPR